MWRSNPRGDGGHVGRAWGTIAGMTEYEMLRQEILAWQERRFTVLTGAITLVVAILSFALTDDTRRWSSELLVIVVFMVLAVATSFTWYAARSNALLGQYLAAFREGPDESFLWETALRKLPTSALGSLNVNVFFALIYTAVAAASLAVAYLQCDPHPNPVARWVAGVTVATFAFANFLTARCSKPPDTDIWKSICAELRPTRPR